MSTQSAKLPLIALSALLAAPAHADGPDPDIIQGPPPGFEIVKITEDPEQDRRPAINSRSQIVFSKRSIPNPNGTEEEIYLYDNGKLRRLTYNSQAEVLPDINDDGVIVWERDFSSTDVEIIRYEDGIEESITANNMLDFRPSIGNSGVIMWSHGPEFETNELYQYSDGEISQVSATGASNQCVTINSNDDYVWVRYDFNAEPFWRSTIMCSIDSQVIELTDGTTQAQGCGINDGGTVTWSDDPGIMLWDDGDLTVLPNSFNGRGPRINNAGDVVYAHWAGEFWTLKLFTGGQTYVLTDSEAEQLANFDIRDSGELTFSIGEFPELDIGMLWRIRMPGDFTGDGAVDVLDFESMVNCMSNVECGVQMPPVCLNMFDFDIDGDIDFHDFGAFQRLVTPNP